tara:strand:+ start:4837 stop:5682 length:846 start_codon:yes stop_codon:yes gene_type:complete
MIFLAYLFISSLAWTLFDLARKHLVHHEQPLALTVAFNVGALPLYLGAWWLSSEQWAASDYWPPAFVAAILAAIAAVGFITALKLGDIARVVPVLALTPIVSTVIAGFMLEESLTLIQWCAMLITVVAIVGAQGGVSYIRGKPFVLMLMVSLCWGGGIVFDKLALRHTGPLFHGVVQTFCVAAVLVCFAFMAKRNITLQGAWYRLIPALFVFVLAVVMQWMALEEIDAGIVETVKRSIGILGALIGGVLIFRERLKRSQIIWCVVILLCIPVILQPEVGLL